MKYINHVLIVLLLSAIIYCQISVNSTLHKNINNVYKLDYYKSFFAIHYKYTGSSICKVFKIENDSFQNFIAQNNIVSNFILIKVDSLECLSCLSLHTENIKILRNKNDIPIIINASLYKNMIKQEIPESIVFENNMEENTDFPSDKISIFYLNPLGKILDFDISNKNYFEISKYFYHSLLKNYTNYEETKNSNF